MTITTLLGELTIGGVATGGSTDAPRYEWYMVVKAMLWLAFGEPHTHGPSRYLSYGLSLRDLREMMAEGGISIDHSTIHCWVVHFAPLLLAT